MLSVGTNNIFEHFIIPSCFVWCSCFFHFIADTEKGEPNLPNGIQSNRCHISHINIHEEGGSDHEIEAPLLLVVSRSNHHRNTAIAASTLNHLAKLTITQQSSQQQASKT